MREEAMGICVSRCEVCQGKRGRCDYQRTRQKGGKGLCFGGGGSEGVAATRLVERPVPPRPLHVEHPNHPGHCVPVPNLERRAPVARHVGEYTVRRRPPRQRCAQHPAVGQDELPQDIRVVLPRRVGHVDAAAAHRARGGVHPGRRVTRLEHVPIRIHHLAGNNGEYPRKEGRGR